MWYLKSAFEAYQKVQDTFQSRLGDVQSAIVSPVEMLNKFLGTTPPTSRAPSESKSEVDGLRRRVAELEERLGKPARQRRKKKGRS